VEGLVPGLLEHPQAGVLGVHGRVHRPPSLPVRPEVVDLGG
jgi:hypothetical protein